MRKEDVKLTAGIFIVIIAAVFALFYYFGSPYQKVTVNYMQSLASDSCGAIGGDYCSQSGSCPSGYSSFGTTYDCNPCCKTSSGGGSGSSGQMQANSGIRGCSNYSERPPVYKSSADTCYSYCSQNGANACEYNGSMCYVEFGTGCYVQSGFSGWYAAVLGGGGTPPPAPQSCGAMGGDYCSQSGSCPNGYSSLGNSSDCGPCCVTNSTSCTPTTCAAQGKNCGSLSDGCGGTLNCGLCISPQTCGGSGTANVCGGSIYPPNPSPTAPYIFNFSASNYRSKCNVGSNCYNVMFGGTIWLSWATSNAGQCEATAKPSFPTTARWTGWSGRVPTASSKYVVGPFLYDPMLPTKYTLTLTCCAGPAITCSNQPDKVTKDITVNVRNQ